MAETEDREAIEHEQGMEILHALADRKRHEREALRAALEAALAERDEEMEDHDERN